MLWVPGPAAVGSWVTEQDDSSSGPALATRVQFGGGPASKVPVPALKSPLPSESNSTVPAGSEAVPAAVSVTVAVQVVVWLTTTGLGVQVTSVLVPRRLTVRSSAQSLL